MTTATAANPSPIGDNSGATAALGDLRIAKDQLNEWLALHPVIQNQEEAVEAAQKVATVKAAAKAADIERTGRVKPLNEEVSEINGTYSTPARQAKALIDTASARMTEFARAEEAKRAAEAARLAAEEEAAKQRVIEAEAREREIAENAAHGEIGGDVLAATSEADKAFGDYERASRLTKRAEKDSRVRLRGATDTKAASMRTTEVLTLASMKGCWDALNEAEREGIVAAFLTAARAHRKRTGELPPGIRREEERKF